MIVWRVSGRGPAAGCGEEMLPGGYVLRVGVSGLTLLYRSILCHNRIGNFCIVKILYFFRSLCYTK